MTASADLIERAKRLAAPVASCVRARVCFGHLVGTDTDVKQLLALITLLAEVADQELLNILCTAPGDEGLPPDAVREVTRRRTDAVVTRLREAGWTPPADESPVLRHEHETDLYPVIAVLAEALTGVPQVAARRSRHEQQGTQERTVA